MVENTHLVSPLAIMSGFMHSPLLLFLLMVFSCGAGAGAAAATFSKVRTLPGFDGTLPFNLETGYIAVDDVQLFYYFIESERNPDEDPLMLWLTGGPGCSAFSGLVYEIGPLSFNIVKYNGSLPTLGLNPYSWTKVSSIIFLDSPVGTGFSYSRSSHGWKSSDTKASKQVYSFLRKWLNDHSKFTKNPFYVAGDSYSGIVVPIIVQEIANGIEANHKPLINLKGYLLENALTDPKIDCNSRIQFAHRMSFLSDELYKLTKQSCKGMYMDVDSRNVRCKKNLQSALERMKNLNTVHVLERNCSLVLPMLNGVQGSRRSLEENLEDYIPDAPIPKFGCRTYNYMLSFYWANDDSTRDALHVKKGTIETWKRCNKSVKSSYIKDVHSAVAYHMNLSTKGYRSLIYSGDSDMKVPYLGTLAWIKSLNFSIVENWRSWFVERQVAGYTRTYSNQMTFATVKGAGHTAPEYMPKECLAMIYRWLNHNPL